MCISLTLNNYTNSYYALKDSRLPGWGLLLYSSERAHVIVLNSNVSPINNYYVFHLGDSQIRLLSQVKSNQTVWSLTVARGEPRP